MSEVKGTSKEVQNLNETHLTKTVKLLTLKLLISQILSVILITLKCHHKPLASSLNIYERMECLSTVKTMIVGKGRRRIKNDVL